MEKLRRESIYSRGRERGREGGREGGRREGRREKRERREGGGGIREGSRREIERIKIYKILKPHLQLVALLKQACYHNSIIL